MAIPWSDSAIRTLGDSSVCPRCGSALTRVGACDACRADLDSPAAIALWDESQQLLTAVHHWREQLDRVPTLATDGLPHGDTVGESGQVESVQPPAPVPTLVRAPQPAAGSPISQQSILAIAGAGLVAVAAIVFTFLNPDLTDLATRTAIIGFVTAVFLGGAWLLARQGLRVSAETIGALGLVFVGLDIWAFAGLDRSNGALLVAVGLLVVSLLLFFLARRSGVLVWMWGALACLLAVPAVFGYAAGNPWATVVGHIAVGAVALAALSGLPRLAPASPRAQALLRATATTAQIAVFAVAPAQVAILVTVGGPEAVPAGVSAALALAVLAALNTRRAQPRTWSFVAGALAASAFAIVPLAIDPNASIWLITLLPAASAMSVIVLAVTTRRRALGSVDTTLLRVGAWSVLLTSALPAVIVTLLRLATPGLPGIAVDSGLAAVLGLASVAAGSAALSRVTLGPAARTATAAVALWFAAGAVAGFAIWGAFALTTQLVVSLGTSAAIAVAVHRVARIAAAPAIRRAPLVVLAHVLVVVAATISWSDPLLSVIGGVAVVGVTLALSVTVAAAPRAVYAGVAFAYSLVVVAAAFGLADLPAIAVLSLTSAVGSALALCATLVRRVATATWYGMLGVSAVPFVVAVGVVLLERSGWSAVSTATTFALALVLVLTRRTGMTTQLRTAAAALLVPSLAVVVVCLCAQLFESSGSPIALPLIAAIVAATLPTTDLLRRALVRRGIPSVEAQRARIAVEGTALVTAAIATLLAVVRVAAGLETTLVVLLVTGVGGAAAAVLARRRYGWLIAGAAWTGALWSGYGLLGIALPEAYLLPPALAAAAVGAFGVARGNGGRWLFVGGLVAATAPSLATLALDGAPARLLGLLSGACVLIVLAISVARVAEGSRLRPLARLTGPAYSIAIVAAASAVLQAARLGTGLDRNPMIADFAMVPIVGLGLIGASIAAVAAHRLSRAPETRSRWLYVPAAVYFAVAPMFGIAHSWLAIWTMWGVMATLLVAMVLTAQASRTRSVTLPPVWLLFALAWCAAVVGWSERELRVEAFSLPLGLALLATGVIAMRGVTERGVTERPGTNRLADWPMGFSGSWHLLAPGLLATLAPSVLSTATDPLTARAVLVIALALGAILVGSKLRLAAPFVLGIVVLPIENVVVFFVQIGRSIGAAPWWITLATAGAVLLVLAVTSERRDSAGQGVAARLRDLS